MTPQQKRKADRLAAVCGYLKFASEHITAADLFIELSALNISMDTLQGYLRELLANKQIHFITEPRVGSNGAPKLHYAYGPGPDGLQRVFTPREKDVSTNRHWLKANEWQRGQHGRDVMVAAMFGAQQKYVVRMTWGKA